MMQIRFGVLISGLALLWPALLSAQTRVVVVDFKGPSAKSVQSAVENVLEDHDIELVPSKRAATTAHRSGADLDSESGRVRVGKKLKVRAFLEGHMRTVKHRTELSIVVFGAADGMPAGEFKTTQSKSAALTKDVHAHLWAAISDALTGNPPTRSSEPDLIDDTAPVAKATKPAPTPTAKRAPVAVAATETEIPPPVSQASDDEAGALAEHADQEEPTSGSGPEVFDVGVGARFGTRSFAYNDSLPGLRGYDLGFSPNLALHAHWYPGAHVTEGVLANIGVDLRGELMVGVSSQNSAGQKFSTSSHAFGVGVRGRIPLDKLELGLIAGFGQHTFSLSNTNKIEPGVPDVVYNFVRTGAEAQYQLMSWFALKGTAAYLIGLSQGELTQSAWFPHGTGSGVEAEISVQAGSPKLVGELAFSVQRYFMALNPNPTDAAVVTNGRVAGGALDEYLSFRLGMIYRH
jgi:hypothetical protein